MKNTNDFKHIIMIITFIFSSMLLLMLLSITAGAQTFKAVDNTVSTDSITITVENVLIDVYISPNGAWYINRISKKGNMYKQYLGYATDYKYEGQIVLSNKEVTKYWYLGFTKSGSLKKLALIME